MTKGTPMSDLRVLIVLGIGTLCVSGCATNALEVAYQSRQVDGQPAQVFDQAVIALHREFPRMHVDRDRRVVESDPVEYEARGNTGTASGLVGGTARMRRIARLRVMPASQGAIAYLRIDVEREDSARRRALQQPETGHRLSDTPSYTPIERDAATTETQNSVWTQVRRDSALERALLTELVEQFAPPEAPGGPPASAASQAAPAAPREPSAAPSERKTNAK
jgi:hypothetical protein